MKQFILVPITSMFLGFCSLYGVAFSIDFRNGTWDHSSVGGPSASTGWAVNSSTSRGYTSGVSEVSPGVFLTVSTSVFGTATFASDNFRRDVVNTPGFAIGNAGTGDRNSVPGSSPTSYVGAVRLTNYQKVNFSFSTPVLMDNLRVSDIDTTNSNTGTQAWRDAVGIEYWQVAPSSTPGDGVNPAISGLGSRLTSATTDRGVSYGWASTNGNTTTSNPAPGNDPSTIVYTSSDVGIDGFSMYIWNAGAGTGGKHSVVLQASGNSFTVVPEPSSILLFGLAGWALILRRNRSRIR